VTYGSAFGGFAHPKGTPRAVTQAQRTRDRVLIDEWESAVVRKRSGGRCELHTERDETCTWTLFRCRRTADHVHHLEGGSGRRLVGDAKLATHKVHCCAEHHRQIHDHRLRLRWDASNPFASLQVEP